MEDRLKLLTEKIYNDGIKRSNLESEKLINTAKEEAQKIIEQAKTESQIILSNAKRDADNLRKKVESELSLSMKQAISKLKGEISSMITLSYSDSSVQESFKDKEFMQKLIIKTVEAWDKEGSQMSLTLALPKEMEAQLDSFIKSNCKKQMDKGMQVIFSDGFHTGFQLRPKDSSFVIDFSDESFMNFFRGYLRPLTKSLMFEK